MEKKRDSERVTHCLPDFLRDMENCFELVVVQMAKYFNLNQKVKSISHLNQTIECSKTENLKS